MLFYYFFSFKVTLNPSIILHVPANMDQRTGRIPNSVGSPPLHNISTQSNVSSISSHVPERRGLSSPNFSHSIDNLVHSNSHSGNAIVPSARPSTIDHLPNMSRQRSIESSEGSYYHNNTQQPPNAPTQGSKAPQKQSKPDGISERSEQRNKEVPRSVVSSSSYRLVDHPSVISPNVNPFDKNCSVGDTNIFDMLPLHMQSSVNKDYKDSVLAGSSADMSNNSKSLKQNHDMQSRSETITPPGLTKHLEGHKASAAMAALAAKLHSQQVSQTARSKPERYLPNKDSPTLVTFQGDEHLPRARMSPVMNIRSPPLSVTKPSTLTYRHSMSEDISGAPTRVKSTVTSNIASVNDPIKTTPGNVPKTGHGDPNKYKKSIAGHPHSMASLLSPHPAKHAASTPVTSIPHPSSTQFSHKAPNEEVGKDATPVQHIDQKQQSNTNATAVQHIDQQLKSSNADVLRSSVATTQQSLVSDKSVNQQRSSSQTLSISGAMSFQSTLAPNSTQLLPVKADSLLAGERPSNDSSKPSARSVISDVGAKTTEVNVSTTLANAHPRNIPVNSKGPPTKSKAPRASKVAQSKTVIKRANPVVTKPNLANASSTASTVPAYSGSQMPGSVTTQQLASTNSSKQQPPTTITSLQEHLNLAVSTSSSQAQQRNHHVTDAAGTKAFHITTSSAPTAVGKFSESDSKQNPLDRPDRVGIGSATGKPVKSVKASSSVTEGSASVVTASLNTTSAQSTSYGTSLRMSTPSTQPVRTLVHSVITSAIHSSKPPSVSLHPKSSNSSSVARASVAPCTISQSVIKFSQDTKPSLSSNTQKSSTVNTAPPTLIRDADSGKPKVIVTSACKVRPLKSSQAIEHTASVISIASASTTKIPNSATVSAVISSAFSNGSSSKKPISVQIVAATSNVVACLSAAAALSQVQSIVKPTKSSSDTSVVSTILRVIPSLVSKSDTAKDQTSTLAPAKSAGQTGSGLIKSISSAQKVPSSRAPILKGHVSSVPFSTAVKVAVVSSSGSENLQAAKVSKLNPEGSLLKTVTSSSTTSLNVKPTHKGSSTGKPQRGAPVSKTKSQRLSNLSATSEDESEAANNAPVASRTRPSTRRITSLSALGPGPLKKGGRNTPVTSPKGANVTSPKGAVSSKGTVPSKGQIPSPNSTRSSVSQAPLTIPGIVTSKAAGKANVQSVASGGGRSSSVPGKIVPTIDSKVENDHAKREQELSTTQSEPVSSTVTQAHSKLESTVAALAKLNESITIQTTRSVTSVIDRPKKQKRSLASIVTDLASKGANQTTVQTKASSSSTDSKLAPLTSSSDTSSRGSKSCSQSPDTKSLSQNIENVTPNELAQKEDPLQEKVATSVSDTVGSTEVSQDRDTTTKCGTDLLERNRETAAQPPSESKPSIDADQKDKKTIEPLEVKSDLSENNIADQCGQDSALVHASHNDTEHNYSEKASAATSKQNNT